MNDLDNNATDRSNGCRLRHAPYQFSDRYTVQTPKLRSFWPRT